MCTYVHVLYCVLFDWYLLCVLMFMYYTVCYFTGIFYAVARQISMLFIDNKDSVFCILYNSSIIDANMCRCRVQTHLRLQTCCLFAERITFILQPQKRGSAYQAKRVLGYN